MPAALAIHATPTPRFVDRPSREPAWKLLHRLADAAYPALQTIWREVFQDVHNAVLTTALQEALARGNTVEAEELIKMTLATTVDAAMHRTLLPLLRETVQQAAEAMRPSTAALLHIDVRVFTTINPEILGVIDTYAGTQIVGIQETTLRTVRQVLRAGVEEGQGAAELARRLRTVVGLTPRQATALDTLRATLMREGLAPATIEQYVARAATRAVRFRATAIARTESIGAGSLGQDVLWQQSAAQGVLDLTRFRRHWLPTPDDRLCLVCAAIPAQNPEGQPLGVPFETAYGPIAYSPAHPFCRCAVTGRFLP